jgi:hypothetical protein
MDRSFLTLQLALNLPKKGRLLSQTKSSPSMGEDKGEGEKIHTLILRFSRRGRRETHHSTIQHLLWLFLGAFRLTPTD